jgi:predicted MFS family arabinose efflux permease
MTGKSNGIFYGWIIIAVSIFNICFSHSGVVNFGFSSFILPLSEEFGFSRGTISLAFTISLLGYMTATPITGALIDLYGVRRVLLAGITVYGTLVCSMHLLTPSLWHLYGMYFLLGIVGTSASVIPYAKLAVSWFDRRKGLALALSSTGAGIAGIVIPPYVRSITELAGWRETFLSLGAINLLVVLPLAYWLVYNTPADKGTYPDGVRPRSSTDEAQALYGFTFRACLRTARFWKMGGVFALFAATHAAPVSQLVPLLVDSGYEQSEAAYVASLLGVSLIVGRLLCGYLVDRYFAPYVAMAFQMFPVFGLTALAVDPGIWSGMFATVTLGLAMGAEFDVMPYFCVQYFGRYAFGKTYAVILIMFALGSAPAAYLAGMSYDLFASYAVVLIAASVLSLAGVALFLTLGPYPELPRQAASLR